MSGRQFLPRVYNYVRNADVIAIGLSQFQPLRLFVQNEGHLQMRKGEPTQHEGFRFS